MVDSGCRSLISPLFVLKVLRQGFFSVGFQSLTVPSAEQDKRRFLIPL